MNTSFTIAGILHDANLRLCRLRLWSDYNGFGFTLRFSSKRFSLVQSIEPYSPAATGGLRVDDVILAIDNQDAFSMDATQCVDMIIRAKERINRIELFVVSKRSYRSLMKQGIPFDLSHATIINTPQARPVDCPTLMRYQPRVCEIYLKKSDDRFGFDITNDRSELGVCISKIYPDTPASRTMLLPGDRIVEINKRSVDRKNKTYIFTKLHHAVLMRYVRLYVMDAETYQYYQSNEISFSSKEYRKTQLEAMKNIKRKGEFVRVFCC